MVEEGGGGGRWLPDEGTVELPGEKPGAALKVVEGEPVLFGQQTGFPRESQCVPDFRERGERNVEKAAELLATATRGPFDDVDGCGEGRPAGLRGQAIAFLGRKTFGRAVDSERQLM